MDLNFFMTLVFPSVLLAGGVIILFCLFNGPLSSADATLRGWGLFFLIVIVVVGGIYVIDRLVSVFTTGKEDIYGSYVIDKDKFRGKQSDWQYDHYRFEITRLDSIFFYETDKSRIVKTYKGTVQIEKNGELTITANEPTSPIIDFKPKLVQKTFSFYYVFHSKMYGNVFFKKGKWNASGV